MRLTLARAGSEGTMFYYSEQDEYLVGLRREDLDSTDEKKGGNKRKWRHEVTHAVANKYNKYLRKIITGLANHDESLRGLELVGAEIFDEIVATYAETLGENFSPKITLTDISIEKRRLRKLVEELGLSNSRQSKEIFSESDKQEAQMVGYTFGALLTVSEAKVNLRALIMSNPEEVVKIIEKMRVRQWSTPDDLARLFVQEIQSMKSYQENLPEGERGKLEPAGIVARLRNSFGI